MYNQSAREAVIHLRQQFSIRLWQYNAKLVLVRLNLDTQVLGL